MTAPADLETYAACLTPAGSGAIATLAVRGPKAWVVMRELFQPRSRTGRRLPDEAEPGRFWLGRMGKETADEVVVALRRRGPAPCVEVHCHGGREVIRLLLETLAVQGVRLCTWQELELATSGDRLQALAAAALAEAPTARTAAILLDQYQGAFRRAINAILAALERKAYPEASRLLTDLARHASLGRHLTRPWRVTVAGAPNVGKSSLVNALAGYQRSVVAATPGTTRDVVTTLIALDGWPVELADTAGLREQADALEAEGIGRARAAAAAADLCLWVMDAAAAPVWPPLPAGSFLLVVNKVDLPPAWATGAAADALHVSARAGTGLAELCRAIAERLVPDPPPPGAAVPFTEEFCAAIEEAQGLSALERIAALRQFLLVSFL